MFAEHNKFRAKSKETNKWVYGKKYESICCVNVDLSNTKRTNKGARKTYIFSGFDRKTEVDVKTIGQYTGIADDNGKKIFEGDILGVTNDAPDYDYTTKVYLDCDTLCVDVEGQDYDYTAIGFAVDIWGDECDKVEIIGNIYDNPELLKV